MMADAGSSSTAEGPRPAKAPEDESRSDVHRPDFAGKKVDADVSNSTERGDQSSSPQEPSVSDRSDKGKAPAAGPSSAPNGMHRGFPPMPMMENWPFSPVMQGAGIDFGAMGLGPMGPFGPLGQPPLVPVLLPAPFPSFYTVPGQEQQLPRGGIFAVPVMPMFGPMGAVPQSGFIPLSFNLPPVGPAVPTDEPTQAPASPAVRPRGEDRPAPQAEARDAAAPDGLRQRRVAAAAPAAVRPGQGAPRPGEPQRQQQVVRRFQVGFQLDLLLILKLAVVVIVFNQDGSKDRLMLLSILASLVYLYQTGALAPILRWISHSAQRAMMPPQQPPAHPDGPVNVGAAGVGPPNIRDGPVGVEARGGIPAGVPPVQEGDVQQEGARAPANVGVDEQRAEPPQQNPNWWGFVKEIQMIVVGFLTSLLPGFQHVE